MKIIFLGGDMRQKYASDYLNGKKFISSYYLDFDLHNVMDEISKADVVGFPLPVSIDGMYLNMSFNNENKILLDDICNILKSDTLAVGGKFPKEFRERFRKIRIVDYMNIESFQIKNALLSAEGGIYYAKQRLDRSIHGSRVAILGSGRIGKILAYLLRSQGAITTVVARRDIDLVWSSIAGHRTQKIDDGRVRNINRYDLIFNTIPEHILDDKFARSIPGDTLIIDLASSPFGMDELLAKQYNLKYYRESGIPGRYAPKSAGEIMGQTIINNILTLED